MHHNNHSKQNGYAVVLILL